MEESNGYQSYLKIVLAIDPTTKTIVAAPEHVLDIMENHPEISCCPDISSLLTSLGEEYLNIDL